MPTTKHNNYTKGKLLLKEIKKQEKKDKEGKTIKFNQVFFEYEHPINGKNVKGLPYFELSLCTAPNGIKLDDSSEYPRLKAKYFFDINDEDVVKCVDVVERTEVNGWIKVDEKVKMKFGVKGAVVTTLDEVEMFTEPNGDESVAKIESGIVTPVLEQNDDASWVQIKTGGKDGFFNKLYDDIAAFLWEKKSELNSLPSDIKTYQDLRNRMGTGVYWYRDDDGVILPDRNPCMFLEHIYFPPRAATAEKAAKPLSYVDIKVPGVEDKLTLPQLSNNSITLQPVVRLLNVYIGSGKIIPKFTVSSGICLDINPIEKVHQQQEEINKLSKDSELVEKLKQKLNLCKTTDDETPSVPVVEKTDTEVKDNGVVMKEEEPVNMESMLTGGPKLEKVNLEEDADLDIKDLPGF